MMATVPHVTSGLGLRKFQADGFLLTGVYKILSNILQSRLTPYAEEIIGDHQCWISTQQSNKTFYIKKFFDTYPSHIL